jgi:hypothetical protein
LCLYQTYHHQTPILGPSRIPPRRSDSPSSIREISEVITRINEFQTTIAGAVEEQTATTNEMGRNVAEAARGTQEIAATISGVAGASSRPGAHRQAAQRERQERVAEARQPDLIPAVLSGSRCLDRRGQADQIAAA